MTPERLVAVQLADQPAADAWNEWCWEHIGTADLGALTHHTPGGGTRHYLRARGFLPYRGEVLPGVHVTVHAALPHVLRFLPVLPTRYLRGLFNGGRP